MDEQGFFWEGGDDESGVVFVPSTAPKSQAVSGEALKEEAISRVEANASRTWLDTAWAAVQYLCRHNREITSDAVWTYLAAFDVPAPHEPRAMGPVMRRAVKEGLLRPTSTFRPSALPQNHRRPVRVYEVVR